MGTIKYIKARSNVFEKGYIEMNYEQISLKSSKVSNPFILIQASSPRASQTNNFTKSVHKSREMIEIFPRECGSRARDVPHKGCKFARRGPFTRHLAFIAFNSAVYEKLTLCERRGRHDTERFDAAKQ